VLLKISRDIKKLNKEFDSFNEEVLRSSLTEIENKINKALNSKGFLPTKDMVIDLLEQVKELKNNLDNYEKAGQKTKIENMKLQIGEIIDQQMFSEIGGAGQYLKNLREAAEKKNN